MRTLYHYKDEPPLCFATVYMSACILDTQTLYKWKSRNFNVQYYVNKINSKSTSENFIFHTCRGWKSYASLNPSNAPTHSFPFLIFFTRFDKGKIFTQALNCWRFLGICVWNYNQINSDGYDKSSTISRTHTVTIIYHMIRIVIEMI